MNLLELKGHLSITDGANGICFTAHYIVQNVSVVTSITYCIQLLRLYYLLCYHRVSRILLCWIHMSRFCFCYLLNYEGLKIVMFTLPLKRKMAQFSCHYDNFFESDFVIVVVIFDQVDVKLYR